MIELKNITFDFPKRAVIKDFSLLLHSDKINCLLGPSGSGKTTLLNILSGALSPQKGEIIGLPEQISYIFQETRILPWKTVYENVIFPIKGKLEKKIIHENAERFLSHVDLWKHKDLYPNELSGGMKQRVSIARAFAYPSSLILMDEAFQGLDVVLKERILSDFIHSWEDEPRTVVFVTHDLDEALLMGQEIIILPQSPISEAKIIQIDQAPGINRNQLVNYKKLIRQAMA